MITYFISSISLVLVGDIVFYSNSYKKYVLTWPDQNRIFWSGFSIGGVQTVLIVPVVYVFLLVWQLLTSREWGVRAIALQFACVIGILTILVPPLPQLWTWIVQFIIISIFISSENNLISRVRIQLGLLGALGTVQILYGIFFHWSFLTQLTFWKKYPWPLREAPVDFVSRHFGDSYANTIQFSLFSIQWALTVCLLVSLFWELNRSSIANPKTP